MLNKYLKFLNEEGEFEFTKSSIEDKFPVRKKVKVACAIIMKKGDNDENLILLIQRAADDHWPLHWEAPRGKCDVGENEELIHCLKREIKEETGLDIEPIKWVDKFVYSADKGKRESTQFNFLCKLKNPNQKVKLSKEHGDFKWISSVGEVELMVLPELKKTITKVLNTNDEIVNYPNNDFSGNERIPE